MELITQRFKRADLIAVRGRIDATTAPRLEAELRGLIAEERFKIAIDLSECDYISSAGIKVLVAIQKEVRRWNRGEVRLSGLSKQPHVNETLEMVGLMPLFKSFDAAIQAVGSF